jgi:hypothetical protein
MIATKQQLREQLKYVDAARWFCDSVRDNSARFSWRQLTDAHRFAQKLRRNGRILLARAMNVDGKILMDMWRTFCRRAESAIGREMTRRNGLRVLKHICDEVSGKELGHGGAIIV